MTIFSTLYSLDCHQDVEKVALSPKFACSWNRAFTRRSPIIARFLRNTCMVQVPEQLPQQPAHYGWYARVPTSDKGGRCRPRMCFHVNSKATKLSSPQNHYPNAALQSNSYTLHS